MGRERTGRSPPWWSRFFRDPSHKGYGTLWRDPFCDPGSSHIRTGTTEKNKNRSVAFISAQLFLVLFKKRSTFWLRSPKAEWLPMLPWAPEWDMVKSNQREGTNNSSVNHFHSSPWSYNEGYCSLLAAERQKGLLFSQTHLIFITMFLFPAIFTFKINVEWKHNI